MCQLPVRAILMSGLVLMCGASAGFAQTARSGGNASAQLMQQMQQLASERTTLQAENAKLKKDLEDVRKDRDTLKKGQQALDRRARSSEVSLKESLEQRAATDKELSQTKDKMQQLITKFKETIGTMRQIEAEGVTAKQSLAKRDQELKVCVDRNMELYKLNAEVLTSLEHQSVWTRTARVEPFTKIKRVQLENLVDDYKERADEQRIAPTAAAPTPTPAAPSAPTSAPPAPSPSPH